MASVMPAIPAPIMAMRRGGEGVEVDMVARREIVMGLNVQEGGPMSMRIERLCEEIYFVMKFGHRGSG
jgi:hypothetical protein